MKIDVIGGGPAGLYFAILRKRSDPADAIAVHERNAPDDTFGWGVVFSEATLDNLRDADGESYDAITATFAKWDAVDVHYRGEVVRSGGHGFCGIERRKLLNILQARAEALGVDLRYRTEVADLGAFRASDLVVAADGINSRVRAIHEAEFRPAVDTRHAKFIWLGTTRPFEAFTFLLRENAHGFFTVHAYQFDERLSTFIVETDEESWRAAGLDRATTEGSVAYLEELYREELLGHRLLTNKSEWINFRTVRNARWSHGNVVLMGDAAHTAHFSIGSGTKLAMEDAICLDLQLREKPTLAEALAEYERERRWYTERLQSSAQESLEWFETIRRRAHYTPRRLAYSMMTRNKRLGHDKLFLRDEAYIRGVNRWFAEEAGAATADPPPPPLFLPFRLRSLELHNRVVVSPMCMYSAEDGTVDDWHLVHLGSRAVGGAGLVMAEMTDVSRDARISPGCAGIYKSEHVPAWRRVTEFVHRYTRAKIGLQLGHAGRKGSTRLMWEGIDEPLRGGNWPIVAASPLPYRPHGQVPREMDRGDMDRVKSDYVRAAGLAEQAGFDMLEIHFAHGYLLAGFLSPLTNRRRDAYGGAIGNRMRFPLEVFEAVRGAWPQGKPISVRLSAIDWHAAGQTIEESIEVARALKERGCDIVDVSTGHTSLEETPGYGRCYQVPFSERIREEARIPTIAVGAIGRHGEANAILASGCADLVALARAHLYDPYFTLHAAAENAFHDQPWPPQYGPAKPLPREALPWLERERLRRRP